MLSYSGELGCSYEGADFSTLIAAYLFRLDQGEDTDIESFDRQLKLSGPVIPLVERYGDGVRGLVSSAESVDLVAIRSVPFGLSNIGIQDIQRRDLALFDSGRRVLRNNVFQARPHVKARLVIEDLALIMYYMISEQEVIYHFHDFDYGNMGILPTEREGKDLMLLEALTVPEITAHVSKYIQKKVGPERLLQINRKYRLDPSLLVERNPSDPQNV